MSYPLPELPPNQRWKITGSLRTFVVVKLQERHWWGWRTIATQYEYLETGNCGVARCVDHIVNRDRYAKLRAAREAERRARRGEIRFGVHRG